MPSNISIVKILWRYKKREQLSDEEIAELSLWLRESSQHELLFEELSNDEKWEREIAKWQEIDSDATWNRIQERVESMSPGSVKEKRRIGWLSYVSAAVCVAIFAGIFWWINSRRSVSHETISLSANHEILPASNTATLTLADGSVIDLNSIRSGKVAHQGNIDIIKTDSAALNYQGSGNNSVDIKYNTLSTPKGSQYSLMLPDSTKVWLNALSTLRFPASFSGPLRKVELNGEAYFEVTGNKNKPFIVQTSRLMSVRVLGTHFNVIAYLNEPVTKAELFEGSISASNGRDSTLIKPGQEVLLNQNGRFSVTAANLEQTTAWRNRIFWYKNAPFDEIMRQLSRWYDMEVIYKEQVNQSYTGILPTNLPLSSVLKILEKSGNVHFTIGEGNKVMVSP